MQNTEARLDDIVVVDADREDYHLLVAALEHRRIDVSFFSSGEAALRSHAARSASLWLVGTRLPDMPGVVLLTLVRRRFRRATIFLVDDAYSAERELAARQAGATAYVCKPPTLEWLKGYEARAPAAGVNGCSDKLQAAIPSRPP
jgi:DNA-binding response OmpR family regulator